ncbi:transglycosylase SLT domain-containing protein [Nonomuraea sp. SBT364]|uniref:transglycosylase SLT domain-containing protein n=1 Tax=Nonomuraea sp. SBT364 TaxID=1580530 RepID=UPI000A946FF3|nr:transglycosylase SLT domain-containing protein [Nonomuraea sp. SBT364]
MSVAHLPGGERLDALLAKVTGDPAEINKIATTWRTLSGDINEFGGALGAAVQIVDDAWKGRSADQFDTYMRKYGRAADDLKSALANAAGSLDAAATALREARTEIAAISRDLSTNATTYKNAHPDAGQAELDEHLRGLVDTAVADAQPHVNTANTALTKAKTDIDAFLSDRGQTFRGIPEIRTQEFTPAKGRTIDWRPEPGYNPQRERTSLQGNGGGNSGGNGGGFGGYGPSGPPPAGGRPAPTGQVKQWIEEAIAILKQHGVPVSKMNASDIWMIIRHESGGNPNAINNWDSNAAKGTPSKGLMQTIDPTFNAHKLPDHGNIYDPVDNIIAGVRYAISRYGSVSNVPGVVNTKTGADYVGY